MVLGSHLNSVLYCCNGIRYYFTHYHYTPGKWNLLIIIPCADLILFKDIVVIEEAQKLTSDGGVFYNHFCIVTFKVILDIFVAVNILPT